MYGKRIRENMGTWGIWAKLNINDEIVVANFVFSQIAAGKLLYESSLMVAVRSTLSNIA